jgi:hypothetical protein
MQDPARAVKTACLALAWVTLAVGVACASPIELPGGSVYEPGRGLRVGSTGLTLGGYSTIVASRDEGGPARLSLDDLALFVTWDPFSRLHFFAELEGEELLSVDDQGKGGRTEARFAVERLYGDLALRDWLNVRIGKFLTPVGRWNVIHAQPLVWTTSRPLVTFLPFDPHTTGAMVFGNLFPGNEAATYELFGQFTEQFAPDPTPQRADHSGGGRFEWTSGPEWSIGSTYVALERHSAWQHVTGLDGLWSHGRFEVMGEFAYETAVHGPGQWGLYLQGVMDVWRHVYLVGRYEHYLPPAERDVNLIVLGAAWKPWDAFIMKLEYDIADHRVEAAPPGIKSSVAVLF